MPLKFLDPHHDPDRHQWPKSNHLVLGSPLVS